MLSALFIILQNGLLLDNISIPNVTIKKLYIKWDKKINISIKDIKILQKKSNNSKINLKEMQGYFSKIKLFDSWFQEINIDHIKYNDFTASFNYYKNKKGFLNIKSEDISLKCSLFIEKNLLNIHLIKFNNFSRKININGNIIIDDKNIELTTSLQIDINHDASLTLLALANQKKLFYKLNSHKNIQDIKYIINLLHLPHELLYWARDAIKSSSLTLHCAFGWLDYAHLDDAYKNIYIDATGNDLDYKYHKKLDAIHTKTTDLEFKNGIFYIRPRDAYSYGIYLNKSWIKIDFTKKQELLSLYLLFDGKLNKDMLNILNTYKIKLPFLQKKGTVNVDMKIDVNLITIAVSAKGKFFIKKANIDYLGLNLDLFHANILLNNYDVNATNMQVKYKNIATSDVNFTYNAKNKKGDIYFKLNKIYFKKLYLKLKKPVNLIYKIRPNNDNIHIDKSYWSEKNKDISVAKTVVPFDLATLKIKIPRTFIESTFVDGYVDGDVFLKSKKANLHLTNFTKLKGKIDLVYDKDISITSKNKIKFHYKNIDFSLKSIFLNQDHTILTINHLSAEDKQFGNIFINKKDISFKIDLVKNKTYLNDISIYLPAILEATSNRKKTKKQTVYLDTFHIEAINANIFITKNRQIISKKINLNLRNSNISAELTYMQGRCLLTYNGSGFNIYGSGFNDLFMEKLFDNSDFKGGNFSFSMRGTKNKYMGELYLADSTILKYKLLNNTLAFINTIPSLTTLSLPSFNNDGIHIKTSYIKFRQQNNLFHIYDTFLKSSELSIAGEGTLNFVKNSINMQLTLKSDIGSNFSKIPLVGYIILNKDCLSTRIKLTGQLNNPTINTLLTKDILIAPLNILKRTITLPLNIFKNK